MKTTILWNSCTRVTAYIIMSMLLLSASAIGINAQNGRPVIKSVTVTPAADPAKEGSSLNIQIDGSGFGGDPGQVTILLSPDIDGPFKNTQVSDGRIAASFDAPQGYKPSHVTVVIGTVSSKTWDSTSSSPAIAIKSVRVIRGQNTSLGVSKFDLTIDGSGFGHDPQKIIIILTPGDGIVSTPKIDFISVSGTTIQASFDANSDYWPDSISVVIGNGHKTYKILADKNGGVEPNQTEEVRVYRSIMPPEDVADVFGRRIAKRFVAVQVTVTNRSKDFQYLIHDISLDLTKILKTSLPYELSSRDLSLLRGVAEKGQIYDRRNFTVRLLEGVGSVAASVIGIGGVGHSYAPSVAMFNGPIETAFSKIIPDLTISQMNRLNDSAFLANSIVLPRQAKVVVVFIPQSIFMSREQQKMFWTEPTSLLATLDFKQIVARVDGKLITEVENIPPQVTALSIDDTDLTEFQALKPVEIKGHIIGQFLNGTKLDLVTSIPGLTVSLVGSPTQQRMDFTLKVEKPISPGTVLDFRISKEQGAQINSYIVNYAPKVPVINTQTLPTIPQGTTEKTITITGSNFIKGFTSVAVSPGDGKITVDKSNITVSDDGTQLTISLKFDTKIPIKTYTLQVTTNPGGTSGTINLTITDPKAGT